ncbi:hypothetical protein BY20_02940 [Escherichia coli O157:H7 str. 2011EL-2101]|nr:hypothetical protein BY20_02940 [Escherichia coli O157:H7 str. 2011EL-2101]EYW75232.1 hypothetical protein BY19_02425 [Escherichia coli O157:H7 str. 2011EL-2099]EZA92959.1 hypothetical protein BY49_03785 [Escherichia coli O157:H7 str. F6750]EZE59745.1 hypothetical protein BX22_07900 [Escherichia coli O157:H7 str. 2009C-4258]
MLYGQNDAIPAFWGSVSGTLMFFSTHASALSRSMALTRSHFSFDSFMPGITGLPSTRVAPRQMVQIPAPSRYAVVWLPSFSSRNWSRISGADAPAPISARTAADRPYLIFAFMDIYRFLIP